MAFAKIVMMALALFVGTAFAFVTPSAFMGRTGGLLEGTGARGSVVTRAYNRCSKPSMAIIDVGSMDELDKIVLTKSKDKLVVVDYSTTWCGPCKLILPKFEKLSDEYKDVVFLKVIGDKTDESSRLMKREGVRSVPSFHFWKGGKKVDSLNGANESALEDTVRALA